jgi:2,4-dienoyl-CoA reductase-like NADH-dependent reductase (Old Yellow Enzyme family)
MLSEPIVLPVSGRRLENRLIKASTTECLADPNTALPNDRHICLYQQWAVGGCGMIITGNVMVDRCCRESSRNVVLDAHNDSNNDSLERFQQWAASIRASSSLAIMQLSHPGRQSPLAVTGFSSPPVAPSAGRKARVQLPGAFGKVAGAITIRRPREATLDDIERITQQFVTSARLAEQAGFDGVQIHGAHGYLLSQFLSKSGNLRTDEYGTNPQGRRRFLLEILRAVRQATSDTFVVGVKLNSKDSRTDGKEREDECIDLIQELCSTGLLDFIELSGGSYEDLLFFDDLKEEGKDGIFIPFAKRLKDMLQQQQHDEEESSSSSMPLIALTGGFRSASIMEKTIVEQNAHLIGLARPMCLDPSIARDILNGTKDMAPSYKLDFFMAKTLMVPVLNSLWHQRQLKRMSEGKHPDLKLSIWYTLLLTFFRTYVWDPSYSKRSQILKKYKT